MAMNQTRIDAMLELAHQLDVTTVYGKIWPPLEGQLLLGSHDLEAALLPEGAPRRVVLGIINGGPPREQVHTGYGKLNRQDADRLKQAIVDAGGYAHEGTLAILMPEQWRERYGGDLSEARRVEQAMADSQEVAPEIVDARAAGQRPILAAAAAREFPPAIGPHPTLFLDHQPVYHLLAALDAPRNALIMVGELNDE